MSAVNMLAEVELGKRPWKLPTLEKSTCKKLNEDCGKVIGLVNSLKAATSARPIDWDDIHNAVSDIIMKLLDNSDVSQLFAVNTKKTVQRECFVMNGGIDALLVLFKPPFLKYGDGRKIPVEEVRRRSEMWNEMLVIIREVAYVIPTLADRIFNTEQMVFFFTMLCHQSVFDNTMNLLEEMLAAREDTFQLSAIPDFYNLMGMFSSRQLAHFCRILSLVLFEPEDRQVMEGSHILHSTELLQLRRNRMTRNCGGAVERNHALIIDAPGLLERLVQILRIVNWGPSLADMISHNIVSQTPITSDILTFFSSALGVSDWDHFASLENIVCAEGGNSSVGASTAASSPVRGSSAAGGGQGTPSRTRDLSTLDDEDITAELLNSFAPTQDGGNSHSSGVMDLSNIVSVMQVARSLGIADMTPLGEALLSATNTPLTTGDTLLTQRSTAGSQSARRQNLLNVTPARAKKELQFHAMLLNPYQIELIFVLCTLLSGRRKIAVQQRLHAAELDTVLLRMFDRMSWGSPPLNPGAAPQHIHGPNCECDAESPVRVQFLRLVHNFYDRDFLGNDNKLLMLSPAERLFVQQERADMEIPRVVSENSGLLCKIIHTLVKEPPESIYKFWLSACVENFLRGCGRMGQFLVSKLGMLEFTVQQIVQHDLEGNASLQTFFDLLGEILKCNHSLLDDFNAQLSDEDFRKVCKVTMTNLIDSNVFVRSLYLSVEMIAYSYAGCERNGVLYPHPTSGMDLFGFHMNSLGAPHTQAPQQRSGALGYLRDTWVQFEPAVLSRRAVPLSSAQLTAGAGAAAADSSKVSSKAGRSDSTASTPRRSGVDTSGESSASSSFSTNILGAFKDIRKATKHFLNFGDNVKAPSTLASTETPLVRKPSAEEVDQDGEFFDCQSSPPAASKHAKRSGDVMSRPPLVQTDESMQRLLLASAVDGSTNTDVVEAQLRSATPLVVPENLSRIVRFLAEEKINIIVRLMSTVSLSTINHENICCLNTVILILLLEHKRGELASILAQVRCRADEDFIIAHRAKHAAVNTLDVSLLDVLLSPKKEEAKKRCACCLDPRSAVSAPAMSTSNVSSTPSVTKLTVGDTDGVVYCGTCDAITETVDISTGTSLVSVVGSVGLDKAVALQSASDDSSPEDTDASTPQSGDLDVDSADADATQSIASKGSEVLCRNFRELLWYWQQYYLRRGRDRLSVEFSAHLPFRYWQALVVLMCRDDGAPTSLLSAPMTLPPGPYQRPIPCHPASSPSDRSTLWNEL